MAQSVSRALPPLMRHWSASWISGLLWLAVCLAAASVMMSYDFIAGRLGSRQAAWPVATSLARQPNRTTIVAFLHPRCVCSQATVTQLLRTVRAHPGADLIVPVFTPPDAMEAGAWRESAYVTTIRAAVPSARIVSDVGGTEAERFGAYTSGTVLVYNAAGREIFRGGITNRRGGEDDNRGLRQLTQALTEAGAVQAQPSPVFGCPLVAPERAGVRR